MLWGQYSIKGTIDPDHDYSWILLYKLENGDQTYVDNADVVDGEFEFKMDENGTSGIYRAYYQIENNLYVEFIYNKEEVDFTFNPENPAESILFNRSEENVIYHEYYRTIRQQQRLIDSIQGLYFNSSEPAKDRELEAEYSNSVARLNTEQERFEKTTEGMIANHIIRASAQHNPEKPLKNPEDYMLEIKSHFFDSMDIKDTVLSHSAFVNDRLRDYVFYLNQGTNYEGRNRLQKEAIDKAVAWVGDAHSVLAKFEETLLLEYMREQNAPMIKYVIEEHYKRLPKAYQDPKLINKVASELKTALGVQAPDFSWETESGRSSLYELVGTDYYIVLFFSSGCPHCQMEVPEFHDFISGIENIKVVTVGLEDNADSWKGMTENYPEFINVLDMDKWSSQKAKDYGVNAIPSYFVLDSEKRILAKPEDFEELKSMFEERE
jgi:peroxiredoxin